MSHFYGKVWANVAKISTRAGTKSTGLRAQAASVKGAIEVELVHDHTTGKDNYHIRQIQWQGEGVYELIATGVLGESRLSK